MAQAVNALGKVLKYGVATGLVCWIGYESLYNSKFFVFRFRLLPLLVDSGHRGVIYNRIGGIQNKIIPEGTHFLIPWFQRVYKYDIRTQPRTMTSLTGTRGLYMPF